MASFEAHGGDCCGAYHIFSVGPCESPAKIERVIGDGEEDCWSIMEGSDTDLELEESLEEGCYLAELVLTDYQLTNYATFISLLKELNFKLVARWKNANTHNMCNMFVRYDESFNYEPDSPRVKEFIESFNL